MEQGVWWVQILKRYIVFILLVFKNKNFEFKKGVGIDHNDKNVRKQGAVLQKDIAT